MELEKKQEATIGENIRNARKNAKLTQETLAEKAGIATITLRQYENGKRQPKIEPLRKIASALGLHISDLVDGTKDGWKSLDTATAFAGMSEKIKAEVEKDVDIAHAIATVIEYQNETVEIHIDENGDEYLGSARWAFVDIVNDYNKLNAVGRNEALKRIRELTFIPEYQRKEK